MRLYLKFNKKTCIDTGLLLLMYLQLVILEFFGWQTFLNKGVTLLILLRLLWQPGKQLKGCVQCIGILISMYCASTIIGESINWNNIKRNFLMQAYPIVYFYYVSFLCSRNPEYMDRIMEKGFWVFNITMLVNMVVMAIQIVRPNLIMAVAVSGTIDYYADTISGLFQYGSVHVVCLFTIFLLLYNMSYQKTLQKKRQRNLLIGYTVLVGAVMVLISVLNDNKAFFILMPIALVLYILTSASVNPKLKKNVLISILIIPVVIGLSYSIVEPFREFVDEEILSVINLISGALHLGNKANGSNERIAIISYALKMPSVWLFGMGFGTAYLYQSGFEGFRHFGQADLGSILLLGGLWYLILLCFVYYKMMKKMFNAKRADVMLWGVTAILLITALYTQCLTRPNITMGMLLIVLVFRMQKADLAERKQAEE